MCVKFRHKELGGRRPNWEQSKNAQKVYLGRNMYVLNSNVNRLTVFWIQPACSWNPPWEILRKLLEGTLIEYICDSMTGQNMAGKHGGEMFQIHAPLISQPKPS